MSDIKIEDENLEFKVRDLRNGNWFWCHKFVLEDKRLTASDKVIYCALAYFADNKKQDCETTNLGIANLCGLHPDTVRAGIKRLEGLKYIKVIRRLGKPNIYVLLKIDATRILIAPPKDNRPPRKNPTPPKIMEGYPPENNGGVKGNNNNNKKKYNNPPMSKDIGGGKPSSKEMKTLFLEAKRILNLKKLTDSGKWNSRYAYLCLKNFGLKKSLEGIKRIADEISPEYQPQSFKGIYNALKRFENRDVGGSKVLKLY